MTNSAIALEPNASPAVALETASQSPPVLILNLFYSGLGIARDLAGRGIRVVGLSAHPRIYGNFTRFCQVRRSPNSQEQPEELAEFLLAQTSRKTNLAG